MKSVRNLVNSLTMIVPKQANKTKHEQILQFTEGECGNHSNNIFSPECEKVF